MQALLTLDCIPTGMELFPAADDDSWTHIKRFIPECDYYIVIVGGRYGAIGPTGKSYTEMEYDYAVESGLPALAFLHKEPGAIPSNKTESSDAGKTALSAFRAKIENARHANYWKARGDLPGKVAISMSSMMKIKPREGWVRASLVPDESAAQELLKLRRRIEELETEILKTSFSGPAGSELLAQGEESISVHFRIEASNGYRDHAETFSWNGILSILGPVLLHESTEGKLKDKLTEVLKNRFRDNYDGKLSSAYPRDEDFQRIKLQLRALGLIQEVKGNIEKDTARWKLTPHGDQVLTQVAAIRSLAKT